MLKVDVCVLRPDLGKDHAERVAFEMLRHEKYCVEDEFEPTRPDGRERDDYDPRATYLIVKRGGKPVAGCRLVYADHTTRLPLEGKPFAFKQPVARTPRYEVSRMMNREEDNSLRRSIGCTLYTGLFSFLQKEQKRIGAAPYGMVTPTYLRGLGMAFSRDCFPTIADEIIDETPLGCSLPHVPFYINLRRWALHFADTSVREPLLAAA